jgi:hypothetical protein
VSRQLLTHRVDGDLGPPLSFQFRHVDVTTWTIKGYFEHEGGSNWITDAVVTQTGDGADVPAEFHFPFLAGQLAEGEITATVEFDDVSFDRFSYPPEQPFRIQVRARN